MLPRWLWDTARTAVDLVISRDCLFCDQSIPDGQGDLGTCNSCHDKLTVDPHRTCPRCTSTVGPHIDATDGCTVCRGESYRFVAAARLNLYDGAIRDAILRSKYLNGETLPYVCGRFLGRKLRTMPDFLTSDLVVPVPLHWFRRVIRGYNQSAEVAYGVSKETGVRYGIHVLRRLRSTALQAALTATARRSNVVGAFAVRTPSTVRGLRILVVDDVLTTGATVNEVTRVLLAAGAAQVRVAVLAHR
jgi:ComF family protein